MTDTLTSERSLAEVRRAATGWLPDALVDDLDEPSVSAHGVEEWTTVAPRRYSSGRIWQKIANRVQGYVIVHSNVMPAATYTWRAKPPQGKSFEGLAAILTSIQEPARNNWGSLFSVSGEESPVPATSEMFLSHVKEAFATTWTRRQLGDWAELAYQLATKILPGDVQVPKKVDDPENEADWWVAIVAHCRGSVANIMTAYDKLVERFVFEVPAEARDRIRFEVLVDE